MFQVVYYFPAEYYLLTQVDWRITNLEFSLSSLEFKCIA